MTEHLDYAHYPFDLDALPPSWAVASVGAVAASIQTGFASGQHNSIGEGVPHLRPMNVSPGGDVDLSDVRFVQDGNGPRLAPGDVLFNNTNSPAWVGKTALVAQDAPLAFSNHMTRLRMADGVVPRFAALQLHYLCTSGYFRHRCKKHVNQASISLTTLAETVPFVLPPMHEQRRIVAKLDELLASSRAARAALNAVPAMLGQYREALLAAAFRGGVSDLDEWELVPVEDLASDLPRSIQSGPFGSSLKHEEFRSSGVLVIGIDNVHSDGFRLGRSNRISEQKYRELSKYAARPGDVLVTVMASVGRCCVVPEDLEPGIITKHVYRISVNRARVLPEYLMYAFQGAETVRVQMAASIRGQTRPGINGEILRQLRVPLAPLAHQREIVSRLRDALSSVRALAEDVRSRVREAHALDAALLVKAFRGELVPQDPADEPASALLARLRAERPAPPPRRRRVPAPA